MDKKLTDLYSLLALLCVVGLGIARASESEGGYYLGIGMALAGSSIKILTKRGALILVAGIFGNMFLRSTTPIFISAAVLACWYLLDFQFSKYNK